MRMNPKIIPSIKNTADEIAKCVVVASHLTYQPHCHTLYTFWVYAPLDVIYLDIPNLIFGDYLGVCEGQHKALCTAHYVSSETHIKQPERGPWEHKILQAFTGVAESEHHSYTHKHLEHTLTAVWCDTLGGWELTS